MNFLLIFYSFTLNRQNVLNSWTSRYKLKHTDTQQKPHSSSSTPPSATITNCICIKYNNKINGNTFFSFVLFENSPQYTLYITLYTKQHMKCTYNVSNMLLRNSQNNTIHKNTSTHSLIHLYQFLHTQNNNNTTHRAFINKHRKSKQKSAV